MKIMLCAINCHENANLFSFLFCFRWQSMDKLESFSNIIKLSSQTNNFQFRIFIISFPILFTKWQLSNFISNFKLANRKSCLPHSKLLSRKKDVVILSQVFQDCINVEHIFRKLDLARFLFIYRQ